MHWQSPVSTCDRQHVTSKDYTTGCSNTLTVRTIFCGKCWHVYFSDQTFHERVVHQMNLPEPFYYIQHTAISQACCDVLSLRGKAVPFERGKDRVRHHFYALSERDHERKNIEKRNCMGEGSESKPVRHTIIFKLTLFLPSTEQESPTRYRTCLDGGVALLDVSHVNVVSLDSITRADLGFYESDNRSLTGILLSLDHTPFASLRTPSLRKVKKKGGRTSNNRHSFRHPRTRAVAPNCCFKSKHDMMARERMWLLRQYDRSFGGLFQRPFRHVRLPNAGNSCLTPLRCLQEEKAPRESNCFGPQQAVQTQRRKCQTPSVITQGAHMDRRRL
jgi:hypothetical protein